MALPDLIEIIPPHGPVRAEITVPGSKSITNRALVLAALADGETTLEGALWSEDTQVMADCLQELGFMINVQPDPREACNRTITVYGLGGTIPQGGPRENPLELFVGNAGTAARFLAAMLCLGEGFYRLHGVPRMHERPQAALFRALRELGYQIGSDNDKLPALIHGGGARAGKCRVSIEESSQFASALLLCASRGGWKVEVVGENAEESPYVAMTAQLVSLFARGPSRFEIEPDASSGSYFHAAAWLLADGSAPSINVAQWPRTDWQIDSRFPGMLPLPPTISRQSDLGDSIMTAIVLAPFGPHPVRFTELGRLRVQECERVAALRTELARCGAKVVESGDTLEVFPSALHGAEIETYNDHRMAMCFATVGLRVPGIQIRNPGCVKKTFPNFFQKLAAPPPHGLGVTIRNARTGQALIDNELFAA
jgi:3-phosphoshikimate 1-carboxyvinyltransferase